LGTSASIKSSNSSISSLSHGASGLIIFIS
jgi:hypothetical protein